MNKYIKTLKNNIVNSFMQNFVLVIASVLLAVILWFVISITIYPTTPKTITNIPLEIDITGTSAEDNGLSVISSDVKTVNVTIKGNRSSIGNFSADDLRASAIIENVNSPGEQELAIDIILNDSSIEYEVENVTPSKVNVMFDKLDTKEVELSVEAPNLTAANDLYMDSADFKCTPGTVEITGPSTQLATIEKAAVLVNNTQELEAAYTFHSSEIVLYDKNGTKIDMSKMTMDANDFTIEIPVYMQKELGLTYDLKYAPSTFDNDSLKLDMSVDKIKLASPNTELEKINEWSIGSIPLYDIDWDYNKTFDIEIPSNYKDLSSISSVTVKLDTDGLAKKTVTVNDISILNAPSDYNCEVNSYGLTFDIIGPEEDIEEITEKDIIVSVDLLKYKIQSNSFSADATISFPNYKKVWAVGLQKVSISATAANSTDTE